MKNLRLYRSLGLVVVAIGLSIPSMWPNPKEHKVAITAATIVVKFTGFLMFFKEDESF